MKFRDLKTGNILTVDDPFVSEQMRKRPARYESVDETPLDPLEDETVGDETTDEGQESKSQPKASKPPKANK